jgi:queuine tRNA-ribosyltransferase
MEIQNQLNSDVAMTLDALIPFSDDLNSQQSAVKTTTSWARRCKGAHRNSSQLLFAITQGGVFKDLRKRSADELIGLDFDGYGIGGLSIGESKETMAEIIKWQTKVLPKNKPRYLMGVGSPIELLNSIMFGVDFFDSTFPTRNARHNEAYTFAGSLNISRGKFKSDFLPIEEGCECYTCKNHTRAYIHHLQRNHETTGLYLMTTHNLFFINRLINEAKKAIKENRYPEFRKDVLKGFSTDKVPKN